MKFSGSQSQGMPSPISQSRVKFSNVEYQSSEDNESEHTGPTSTYFDAVYEEEQQQEGGKSHLPYP